MIHRPNSLHQLNKQNGYNWTIMHTALPCSFIIERCESHDRVYSSMTEGAMISTQLIVNIAMSEDYEGRDLHILK